MLKFYDNEYSFVRVERLRIYLTKEFKYCTLTCTLVGGGSKRLFHPHCKMDLYLGEGEEGGRDSAHCGFYQDTKTFYLKSGVTPCWLVQVCFSPKFGSWKQIYIYIYIYILRDFLIPGIAPCYVELMSTSICRSKRLSLWTRPGPRHNIHWKSHREAAKTTIR